MSTSKKITDLNAITDAANSDLLYIVHDPSNIPTSYKITVSNLLKTVDQSSQITAAYTNSVTYTDRVAVATYGNAASYTDTIAMALYSNVMSRANSLTTAAYTNAVAAANSLAYAAYSNAVAMIGNGGGNANTGNVTFTQYGDYPVIGVANDRDLVILSNNGVSIASNNYVQIVASSDGSPFGSGNSQSYLYVEKDYAASYVTYYDSTANVSSWAEKDFYANGLSVSYGSFSNNDYSYSFGYSMNPSYKFGGYGLDIQPSGAFENRLTIFPTADYDIHLFESSTNGAITLGAYGSTNFRVYGSGGSDAAGNYGNDVRAELVGNSIFHISTNNASYSWMFDADGNFTLPDGAIISGSGFYAGPGQNAVLGQNDFKTQIYTQQTGVGIQSYDSTGNIYYTWIHDDTGSMILPNLSSIRDVADNAEPQGVILTVNGNETKFDTGGRTHFPNDLVVNTGRINFPQSTYNIPDVTNRTGEKITLWDEPGYYSYSIGIELDNMWFGVDDNILNAPAEGFKWYTGNNVIMKLARNGNLTVNSSITFGDSSVQNTAFSNDVVATWLSDGSDKVITGNNITLNGNVVVNGNTQFFTSNDVVYTDSLIELHAPGGDVSNTWNANDGKDIGVRFHYYNAGDKNAALVLANDSHYLEFYVDGNESAGVFSGTYGDIKANNFIGTANNAAHLNGNTASDLNSYSDGAAGVAYSNSVSYVNSKSYANTSQLSSSSSTAYSNAVSYVDGKSYVNTSQLSSSSATAYSNAVSYVDGKSYVNTSQLSSNLSNYASLSGAAFTNNVSVANTLTVNKLTSLGAVEEDFVAYSNANGLFTFDCSTSTIFYLNTPANNFTPSLSNFTLANNNVTTVTFVVNQGSTPYVTTSNVQIGGTNTTINWQGGLVPTGSASKRDLITLSIFNLSGTYVALGQLTSFG